MNTLIPTEVYLPILDLTIEVHWSYHAILMFVLWFLIVPVGIFVIRYFKPEPTTYGIEKGTGKLDKKLLWWTIHYYFLYSAIGFSLAGISFAIFVSGGFSGTLHAVFGISTVIFGCLQIFSAWFRGSHGGKHGVDSHPDEPDTWRGDHFDMTPQRKRFETYHKTAGYFTLLLALGTVISGLLQFWIVEIAVALVVILMAGLLVSIILELKGYRQDTYRSVYGDHPEHPYNKIRNFNSSDNH